MKVILLLLQLLQYLPAAEQLLVELHKIIQDCLAKQQAATSAKNAQVGSKTEPSQAVSAKNTPTQSPPVPIPPDTIHIQGWTAQDEADFQRIEKGD